VSRWYPLALLCAGLLAWMMFPRIGNGLATLCGGVFYTAAAIVAFFGLAYLIPERGSPSARPYAAAVALAVLAALASLAHPHSFARAIEHIVDADD